MQQTKQIKKTKRTSLKKKKTKRTIFSFFSYESKDISISETNIFTIHNYIKIYDLKKKKKIIQVSLINFLSILEASLKTKTNKRNLFSLCLVDEKM